MSIPIEVQGSGFRVQGSGFRVQGSRVRVQGTSYTFPAEGGPAFGGKT